MIEKIKAAIKKVRDAVYGLDVRSAIADTMDLILNHTVETKAEIDELVENQYKKMDELQQHYYEVITKGGDSITEIVDARVPFSSLKEKLDYMEQTALENSEDILIGGERDKQIKVFDSNGDTIGTLSKDGFNFSEIYVGDIYSDSIVRVQGTSDITTLYVDSVNGSNTNDGSEAYPLKTITQALNNIGKYIHRNVKINVKKGTYNEYVKFYGFIGSGRIELEFEEGSTLNGGIVGLGTIARLFIYGNNVVINHNYDTAFTSPIAMEGVNYLYLKQVNVRGDLGKSVYGVISRRGSNVVIENSDVSHLNNGYAIGAMETSTIYANNTTGENNKSALRATLGGNVYVNGTTPYASGPDVNIAGQIIGTPNPTKPVISSNGNTSAGVIEVEVKPTGIYSHRSVSGWTSNTATHKLYQGKYNKSNPDTYNWRGVMAYNVTAIQNALAGKTVVSATIDINRKSTGGDYSTVAVRLYGSVSKGGTGAAPALTYDYGTIGNANKGGKHTFTIPVKAINDLKAGNINSLMLAHPAGTTEVRNYAIFETTSGVLTIQVK